MTSKEYFEDNIVEYYNFDYYTKVLNVTNVYATDKQLSEAFNYIENLSFLSDAKYYLGYAYLTGRGTYKSIDKAVEYFESAIEDDNASAMMHLGRCYINGWGVKQSRTKALQLLQQGADNGNAEAWYFIFLFYFIDIENDIRTGRINFEEDMERAKLLSYYLYQSLKCGIHFSNSSHRYEAFHMLLSVANDNHFSNDTINKISSASASYYLYKIFYNGEFGFKEDVDTALEYLEKSKTVDLDLTSLEDTSNDDDFEMDNNGTLSLYCGDNQKVVIPDSVTSIGSGSFMPHDNLKEVVISNSVISIGNMAFLGCTSLKSVEIPDSVISIGSMAFYDCTSLESIKIPDSVISIGSMAFCDCITIYCHKNSYAEKYAKENDIEFEIV